MVLHEDIQGLRDYIEVFILKYIGMTIPQPPEMGSKIVARL